MPSTPPTRATGRERAVPPTRATGARRAPPRTAVRCLAGAVAAAGLVLLAACCPAAANPPGDLAALRGRLEVGAAGGLTAVLPAGERVALERNAVAGAAPVGVPLYLRGTWLPDGRLSLTDAEPLPGPP